MSKNHHPSVIVNQSLHRLALVLDILDEISTGASYPGDDELKHGSLQALRSMVECLQRVEPQQINRANAPSAVEMQIATAWLLGERPRKLLPPPLFAELSDLIRKLLPESVEVMSGQNETH